MYILTGDEKQIINSEFVERFCLVEHPDAVVVAASYSDTRRLITVSKYADMKEARSVLDKLLAALQRGDRGFVFPLSSLFYSEEAKRDSRTKRKGGS